MFYINNKCLIISLIQTTTNKIIYFIFFLFCVDNIIDLQSESSVSTKNIEKPCFMYMVDTTILQILYVSFIK